MSTRRERPHVTRASGRFGGLEQSPVHEDPNRSGLGLEKEAGRLGTQEQQRDDPHGDGKNAHRNEGEQPSPHLSVERRTLLAMEPGGETARGDTYRGSYAVVRRKGSEGDSEDDDDDDAVAPDVFSPLSSKLSSKLASGKEGGRARGVSSGSPSLASLLGSTKLGDSREQIV